MAGTFFSTYLTRYPFIRQENIPSTEKPSSRRYVNRSLSIVKILSVIWQLSYSHERLRDSVLYTIEKASASKGAPPGASLGSGRCIVGCCMRTISLSLNAYI